MLPPNWILRFVFSKTETSSSPSSCADESTTTASCLRLCLVQNHEQGSEETGQSAVTATAMVQPETNVSVYNVLNEMKLSIDQYRDEWYLYKRYTNPFEFVYTNNTQESVCRMKPISRAYFKLFEILEPLSWFQLPTLNSPSSGVRPLRAFCLAEGPGGFIQALLHRRRAICAALGTRLEDRYVGMTMEMPQDGTVPGWRKSRRFLEENREWVSVERGSSGNGNLLLFENLQSILYKYVSSNSHTDRTDDNHHPARQTTTAPPTLELDDPASSSSPWMEASSTRRRGGGGGGAASIGSTGETVRRRCKMFDLVTGDAGFDFSTDYSNQELNMSQLLLVQTLYAALVLRPGGTFVLKLFDVFYEKTLQLLYLMSQWFAQVEVLKPCMSRTANSEKYVLCTGFRGLSRDDRTQIVDFARSVMTLSTDDFATQVHDYSIVVPRSFRNQIGVLNTMFARSQIESIHHTLELIADPDRDTTCRDLFRRHIALCVQWCRHFQFDIHSKYLLPLSSLPSSSKPKKVSPAPLTLSSPSPVTTSVSSSLSTSSSFTSSSSSSSLTSSEDGHPSVPLSPPTDIQWEDIFPVHESDDVISNTTMEAATAAAAEMGIVSANVWKTRKTWTRHATTEEDSGPYSSSVQNPPQSRESTPRHEDWHPSSRSGSPWTVTERLCRHFTFDTDTDNNNLSPPRSESFSSTTSPTATACTASSEIPTTVETTTCPSFPIPTGATAMKHMNFGSTPVATAPDLGVHGSRSSTYPFTTTAVAAAPVTRYHRMNQFSWLAQQPVKGTAMRNADSSMGSWDGGARQTWARPSSSSSSSFSLSARSLQLGLSPITLVDLPRPPIAPTLSSSTAAKMATVSAALPPHSIPLFSAPVPLCTMHHSSSSFSTFSSRPFFKKKRHVNLFQGPQSNMFLPAAAPPSDPHAARL